MSDLSSKTTTNRRRHHRVRNWETGAETTRCFEYSSTRSMLLDDAQGPPRTRLTGVATLTRTGRQCSKEDTPESSPKSSRVGQAAVVGVGAFVDSLSSQAEGGLRASWRKRFKSLSRDGVRIYAWISKHQPVVIIIGVGAGAPPESRPHAESYQGQLPLLRLLESSRATESTDHAAEEA